MRLKKMFKQETLKSKKGITIVLVAIMLTVLLGFVALAVDVGNLMASRNELQNVADAAALAGAGYMGSVYKNLNLSQQSSHTFSKAEIATVVNQVSQQNKASGVNISVNEADIILGEWDPNTKTISPVTLTGPNAVNVTARRDGSANTPIATFFARIFGINTVNVTAEATAALTGPYSVSDLQTPFALSQNVFPNNCTDTIQFSPTTDSCAGWHNFFDDANASSMETTMLALIEGHLGGGLVSGSDWLANNFDINKSPDGMTINAATGDSINFIGGNVSSLFLGGYFLDDYDGNGGTIEGNDKKPAPFIALFDYFRYRDGDGNDDWWTTTVPVYEEEGGGCGNPSGPIKIAGFADITVYMPNPPPDSTVSVKVVCNMTVTEGRGGGFYYGNLKGSVPNLVQ